MDNAFRYLVPFRLDVAHKSDGPTDRQTERPLAIARSNDAS